MKTKQFCFAMAAGLVFALASAGHAQVPQLINYQGRVVVGPTNFNGTGQFKFAIVSPAGDKTYWSNDGTSNAGSEPTNAVSITVANGLYSVLLGDATLTNMTTIPVIAFNNSDIRLRVWFNDGTNGSQLLSPDQRIAAVGYAMMAANVADGVVTGAKIAAGTITSNNIANGAIGAPQLGTSSVGSVNIAAGAVTSAKIDNTTVQQRVSGAAPTGQFLQAINADGTVLAGVPGAASGVQSTAIGLLALPSNTGSFNTAHGWGALGNNTTGQSNTAIGDRALYNANANYNTAAGDLALYFNSASGNSALGYAALYNNTSGLNNNAVGVEALYTNTTGPYNNAFGNAALYSNTSGDRNTAIGESALLNNTTGYQNVAIGVSAIRNGSSGTYNVAVGNDALGNNNAPDNTAVGNQALFSNSSGADNTGIGFQALYNTNAQYNTAVGAGSLFSNTNGADNVAVGNGALNKIIGSGNTAIGFLAGSNNTSGSNNIYIGATVFGAASESNTCKIANITSSAISGSAVYIDSNNRLGLVASSKRFKKDIKPMANASQALFALKPVSFRYKKEIDPENTPQLGLVAEEVEKVDPALVIHDKKGKPYTVRYDQVNAMLLNEFLKEHDIVEREQKTIANLKADLAQQRRQIQRLIPAVEKISDKVKLSNAASQLAHR
jgi:hypothetical protein